MVDKRARWRKWDDMPESYRLRRGGDRGGMELVAAERLPDGRWFWHTIERPEGVAIVNTASVPVASFEAVKVQVKKWLAKNGT